MIRNDVFKSSQPRFDLGPIELRKFLCFIKLNFASAALSEFIPT